MVKHYGLLVFAVVKAHVATVPRYPTTIHYRGDGAFMVAGENTRRYRHLLRPGMP